MSLKKVGEDFCKIVNNLGENVTFNLTRNDTDMPMLETVKACLETATSAAYSMVDREFLFKGNMIVPLLKNVHDLAGLYFTREILPNVNYMMISAIPEPTTPTLCFIYAVQCNGEVVLLQKQTSDMESRDEWGNIVTKYKRVSKNIPCYWYTTLRSYKIQNNGRLDQAIYSLYIPAKYKLSPMDKIIKKGFWDGEYKEQIYSVDSVETAMSRESKTDGETVGIISAQLTVNLDKVVIEP